jgi:hypothetical protein
MDRCLKAERERATGATLRAGRLQVSAPAFQWDRYLDTIAPARCFVSRLHFQLMGLYAFTWNVECNVFNAGGLKAEIASGKNREMYSIIHMIDFNHCSINWLLNCQFS